MPQQVQPLDQRHRRRQQRLDRKVALPRKRLPFQTLRLAAPVAADVEMQAHVGVLIDMLDAAPRLGRHDRDAQLLDEFALQRIEYALAPFHLATWELPVTGIRLAT